MTKEELVELHHRVSQDELFRATVYALVGVLLGNGIILGDDYEAKLKEGIERQIENREARPL